MPRLGPLDLLVLALYGLVVVTIGFVANRRQTTTDDYFLGGRRLGWWAVGVSLIATSFSSAALIGATGFGYARGLGWLQLQLGDLAAVTVACLLFLPFFSRLRLTTAYEYLERRFGPGARRLASALFLVQTLLRTGILVLGPALAIAAVTDLDLAGAIVLSGVAAIVYSVTGGMQAVVWTDLLQMSVVLAGVGVAFVLLVGDTPGGAAALVDHAEAAGRLEPVTGGLDPSTPFTLVGALLAYGTLALSVAGTNQQAVQRYMSTRDLTSARRAAFLGWGIGFVAVAATLLLGTALAGWAELAPAATAYRNAMDGAKADTALPLFLVHRMPPGLAGLMVAAIFAASMSSMDSAIHAMSTATLVDFVRPLRRKTRDDRSDLRLARALTAGFGLLAILAAMVAAQQGRQLLEQLISWLGYVAGPLLGLFLLGLLTVRADAFGALLGTTVGALFVVGVAVTRAGGHLTVGALTVPGLGWLPGLHPLWLAPAALVLTFGVGYAASTPGAAPPERTEGLTWWTRPTPRRPAGGRSGRHRAPRS